MTFEQLMMMPSGMSIEQYQRQLDAQEKNNKRLRQLSKERDFLEDALEILKDEQGSERYEKKAKRLAKVNEEIERRMRS